MIRSTSIFLILINLHTSIGFTIPTQHTHHPSNCYPTITPTTTTLHSTTESSSPPIEIDGRTILTTKLDPTTYSSPHPSNQIMQLASFRNNLQSPLMTIAAQSTKRAQLDPQADALKGLVKGLSIGLVVGIATTVASLSDSDNNGVLSDALTSGLENFALVGLGVGSLLAYNGYSGNSVYVSNEKEMINRLTVDYVASVKVGQDVGFAAYASESAPSLPTAADYETFRDGRYVGTCGMVACVDCQLRNSNVSTAIDAETAKTFETRIVKGLPPHLHVKNMAVDEKVRRKGIGMALLRCVEKWAREETDAEMMSLEVDDWNTGAVKLYESYGFVKDEKRQGSKIGRFVMKKDL